ncbi:phage tail protein [Nocardia vinacea]|uniref:Phage tail protein n=1 Tax=Nocardia vinacea TaxID=96468 RepID=A0ABZ1YHV6_9NOCA|nr:phage tail protein [Nocardia vinacea]
MHNRTLVQLEGCNGDWITLSGPGMGAEGAILGTDVEGIYDAPVKTIYTSHAHQIGASYAAMRNLRRDITFGVWIGKEDGESWLSNDSRWRKAWAYNRDSRLWIETEESGRRYLKVRLAEQPLFKPERDPNITQSARVVMTVVAGDPWWYEEKDQTSSWVLESGTAGSGFVTVSNPTDNELWMRWLLQGGARWKVPDLSLGDDRFARAVQDAARKIEMPKQNAGQTFLIDTDPFAEMLRDPSGTQVWALMNGVTFNYPLPAYTAPMQLPVSVTEATVGVGIQVRCTRGWSRPWGLE